MKKIIKYCSAVIGIALTSICIAGCSTVSSDHLHGVSKTDYKNQLVTEEINYYMKNDSLFPEKKDKKVLAQKAVKHAQKIENYIKHEKKEKVHYNKDELNVELKETMSSTLNQVNHSDYNKILKENGTTDKAYRRYMRKVIKAYDGLDQLLTIYQSRAMKNPKQFLNKTAGTINGHKIDYETYYFYFMQDRMARKMLGESGTAKRQEVMSAIASDQNAVNYCKKNGITITESDISRELDIQQKSIRSMYKDDKDFLAFTSGYGFTTERFYKNLRKYAKVCAYNTALENKLSEQVNPSFNDIEKYYTKHYAANEKTIVFVEHALFKKKEDAWDFYNQNTNIKSKDDFKTAIKRYKEEHKNSVAMVEDLPNIERGELGGTFGKEIFKVKSNKIFKPIHGDYGYHVGIVYQRDEDIKTSVKNDYNHLRKLTKQEMGKGEYNEIRHDRSNTQINVNKVKTILENYLDN